MKILVVDDEPEILKQVAILVESSGHAVKVATNVESLRLILKSKNFIPQVIVLDRILHGVDAITILEEIKKSFVEVPVLVLSAVDTAYEKAAALNAGADDYLAKPFSSLELLARIHALGRRTNLYSSGAELVLGNVKVNKDQRTVLVNDNVSLDLSNKEFQIFHLFCSNPGKIFSKEILLEQIWKASEDIESKVVEATINNLRRKLEAAQASLRIKNMRNTGYWLEA